MVGMSILIKKIKRIMSCLTLSFNYYPATILRSSSSRVLISTLSDEHIPSSFTPLITERMRSHLLRNSLISCCGMSKGLQQTR